MDCMPQIHVAAYHYSQEYNNNTPGIGIYCDNDGYYLVAGTYYNSNRRSSSYIGSIYQPIKYASTEIGMFYGIVDGYTDSISPFGGLAISYTHTKHIKSHVLIIPGIRNYNPTTYEYSITLDIK